MKEICFNEVVLERGNKRVEWEWIGEGLSGDFDPDDPNDIPLLRFSCYQFDLTHGSAGEWVQMDDASYCTRMSVDSNIQMLAMSAAIILEAVSDISYKKRLEELSWFCPEDFERIFK